MDPYMALIGGTPTEADQQQQLAKGLRRDANFGELGMITGDKVLAPYGQGMINRADSQAKTMGTNRMADVKQKRLAKYYDAQEAQMTSNTERLASRLDLDEQKQKDLNAWREAQIKNWEAELAQEGAAGPDYNKLRRGDITDLKDRGGINIQMGSLAGKLDDEDFDPGHVPGLPGARTALNAVGRYGYGRQKDKDVQDWWAQYDKFYTLPERNAAFGATLTPSEGAAWAGANISPEMTKKQIKEKLAVLRGVLESSAERMTSGYVSEGYNPESVFGFIGMDNPYESRKRGSRESGGDRGEVTGETDDGWTTLPSGIRVREISDG